MAVYIEVCDGIGQGFKKLEPVRKWIDSIAALLRQSEGSGRQPAPVLPRPEERKQLEPPRARLAPPKRSGSDLDDDIPF
jgi:hypothetical protein